MKNRSLPTLLLILLIALQSVVSSADLHPVFDDPTAHNALALEHSHGNGEPLHGHDSSDVHASADAGESADLNQDSDCGHCCHCHNPSPASAFIQSLQAVTEKASQQLVTHHFQPRLQPYSPAFRPPIAAWVLS